MQYNWTLATPLVLGRKVGDNYELMLISWSQSEDCGRFVTANLSLDSVRDLHEALGEYLAGYD